MACPGQSISSLDYSVAFNWSLYAQVFSKPGKIRTQTTTVYTEIIQWCSTAAEYPVVELVPRPYYEYRASCTCGLIEYSQVNITWVSLASYPRTLYITRLVTGYCALRIFVNIPRWRRKDTIPQTSLHTIEIKCLNAKNGMLTCLFDQHIRENIDSVGESIFF